jgi:hypothetical protein
MVARSQSKDRQLCRQTMLKIGVRLNRHKNVHLAAGGASFQQRCFENDDMPIRREGFLFDYLPATSTNPDIVFRIEK